MHYLKLVSFAHCLRLLKDQFSESGDPVFVLCNTQYLAQCPVQPVLNTVDP